MVSTNVYLAIAKKKLDLGNNSTWRSLWSTVSYNAKNLAEKYINFQFLLLKKNRQQNNYVNIGNMDEVV